MKRRTQVGNSILKWKSIALLGMVAALVLVMACGGDDETAAPAPAPTPDFAKLIQDAVGNMPQGASAAEIQGLVSQEVNAALNARPGASAAEIENLVSNAVNAALNARPGASAAEIEGLVSNAVNAALNAQPGLTRADVESIVSSATANQLSAADVQRIVDQSVRSLPVPETLDASEISALVENALPALPESVSAAQISQIVQDQVEAGQAGQLTRGDVEDLVAQAVEGAVGGQLSADDVKAIVDSSLMATNEAIEQAAMSANEARLTAMKAVEKEPIVFSDLNWASAQVQDRIAQYIVDKGYGYPTDVVFGATLPLFQGLRRGDSHVTMEIWLPNQAEAWMEAQAAGEVISVGKSLGKDWQSSFVIPAYLAEQHPDLDSVDDLKDDKYKELFATAETGGKARLVSCVIGWACEDVNAKQIEGYGLSDHVHVVNPGDSAAANADLYGSYEKGEPWLGYQWGTNDPALLLDLVRLEEPEYSDECWFTTKACAYEDATILIAVHPDLTTRAPEVVAMLRAWDFNIDIFKEVASWQSDNADASTNDAALWWLKGNTDLWSGWVTADAAEAITTALDANEIPDGWPTE